MVWEQPTWKDILFQGKVINAVITKSSCSDILTVRKEAFTQFMPSTNFSPVCLGASNLPDSSLNLLFRKRSLCFSFHQPNTTEDMYPGPKSSALLSYQGRIERFYLFCFALFGQFFKQKVYRDRQWWKDITTNINILLADILAPTVMKMNYISFNSFTLTTY